MKTVKQKDKQLIVTDAFENNLKHINVSIPHNALTVITGVSGSGKSTLATHVIYRESQRRFLSSFSSFSRQYMGKLEKPKVGAISGLQPALTIRQQTVATNPHSTVGTMSGLYDYLRLLFARMGVGHCLKCGQNYAHPDETRCSNCSVERPRQLARLFSFNSSYGACRTCNGLGVTEQIDLEKLIANPELSLREGALVPTTPTGYIVYSQVTVDALDKVCQAHGFNVDIPWKALTDEQKNVVLYGSNRVKILFGKHALESRLKWKGITARPRTEAYYKGMMPIMEDILRRDRNDNILRFASAFSCRDCGGTRLRKEALAVEVQASTIAQLCKLPINSLEKLLQSMQSQIAQPQLFERVMEKAFKRIYYLRMLGLGYLSLDRGSATLSGGEAQRIRLAAQIGSGLQGVLYVLDEPSVGLHPYDNRNLLSMLHALRNNGNTLLVVEHDEDTIRSADYLIDIGPKAGTEGGCLIYQGKPDGLLFQPDKYPESITARTFALPALVSHQRRKGKGLLHILQARLHNLKAIDVRFLLGAFNVVTGVSGAGKSTLVHQVMATSIRQQGKPIGCEALHSELPIERLIEVDQSPIGRTPRSNPATYTGLFDVIRDSFAAQPEAVASGFNKGRFSFNNAGGRCEQCGGAGSIQLGMHFLGDVEICCDVCNGKRFNDETLAITLQGKNISEVLDLTVKEAAEFFARVPKAKKILDQLVCLDLGYLKLGQASTTLSGGEAQRVKLATELRKSAKGHCLYLLDEPTTGLHKADVAALLAAFDKLVKQGNTLVVIEHDPAIILQADWLVDLGPESGENGGQLMLNGTVKELLMHNRSLTAKALRDYLGGNAPQKQPLSQSLPDTQTIQLSGIATNNLRHIDVRIPHHQTTVITGVSGSGKSSLAFDTIYAECRNRFTESYTSYARRMMSKLARPELEQGSGFSPAIAIRQSRFGHNPRSTVGTMTGLYDLYRLLFSRAGIAGNGKPTKLSAAMFSFNKAHAACNLCGGLGKRLIADPEQFVTHPSRPLGDGAMDGTKPGKFFGEKSGQYIQTLKAVGREKQIDFEQPYNVLNDEARQIALYGCGEEMFEVNWSFQRGNRHGTHQLNTPWKGLAKLIEEDYEIKRTGKRAAAFSGIMREEICAACKGQRLQSEALAVSVGGLSVSAVSALTVHEAISFFTSLPPKLSGLQKEAGKMLAAEALVKLQVLQQLGLGYLSADRQADSLSGGEAQRLRIASQLEADLCGITYVFDEPTIGLHPRDTQQLLGILNKLKAKGNTLILVEHDPDVIVQADHVIDLGPGAGHYGGNIIAEGSPSQIRSNPASVTGRYLNKTIKVHPRKARKQGKELYIKGASANNLQQLDLRIPSGMLIAVTGVSGSGKSSLVFDVIAASFNAGSAVNCQAISFGDMGHMMLADQHSIGTSPLSTAVTYTGIFDDIRDLFAQLPESRKNGFTKKYFSYNNAEGNCPHCKGHGSIKVSLDFLSDVWTSCEVCHGTRYKPEMLKMQYHGKGIHQVLEMEISEAISHFDEQAKITTKLKVLEEVGLGYLRLGQAANTLSGGEIQRLKLAKELMHEKGGKTLFLFDEPTTGLHMQDVELLLRLFDRLLDQGHTVMVVEHNLSVIAASDWLIDLGPEGGAEGGRLLYNGSLSASFSCKISETVKCLKPWMG
ncbi:MAG: excinuclease ABC subunit UvrA [Bacteroidetes bacterium]|jgi:excinuclease ABC subunit A|nr:excinuclease ABC subunit UvrA [Bacteroidota bacterium]